MPVAQNFIGAATLRDDEVYSFDHTIRGVGLIGLGPISLTPYRGNFFNSTIVFDNHALPVQDVEWAGCEGVRHSFREGVKVTNRVRLPFEQRAVLQEWQVQAASSTTVDAQLDGPFFRRCDDVPRTEFGSQSCGWGTFQPADRDKFKTSIRQLGGLSVSVVEDSLTRAVSASTWWCTTVAAGASCSASLHTAPNTENVGGFWGQVVFTNASRHGGLFYIRHATVVADTVPEALTALQLYIGDAAFETAFRDSCSRWEERWASAFDAEDPHFSGSLPTLKSDSADLDRLYNWAALAVVSLERTNMLSFPRQFVISEGPSNSLRGDADMGGSGQFLWDLSFAATSYSLLDPAFARHALSYVIENTDFRSTPIGIPQTWDSYPAASTIGGGQYCFDYVSAFLLVQQYVVTTNDTSLLTEEFSNSHDPNLRVSGLDFLRSVAWSWLAYNRSNVSEYLVDYGDDKRSFLEAVPTYTSVIPALQFSNAGMLLSLARLLEALDVSSAPARHAELRRETEALRGNATAILRDALRFQYVPRKGFWACLHANGSAPTPVRAISDTIYVGLGVGLLGNVDAALPQDVRQEVAKFFKEELLGNGWTRALSLSDPVMAEVQDPNPSLEAKLAMRADWTGTGAYGGLPGLAVDALATFEQGLEGPLMVLRNLSLAARSSMPSQGIAVTTPKFMSDFLNGNNGLPAPAGPYAAGFPEFFDEGSFGIGSWWPHSLRSIQNAIGAIVDSFVRSVFGWRPDWGTWTNATDPEAAITSALYLPKAPRSAFKGTLFGVRTPHGRIDLTAGPSGVSWAWSRDVDGAGDRVVVV